MIAVIREYAEANKCREKEDAYTQDPKEQFQGEGFPLKFKELLGFLYIFFVSGFLLGLLVAGWVFVYYFR